MDLDNNLTRRGFLVSAGTVLASLTVPLVSGPAAAFADEVVPAEEDVPASETAASKIVVVHTNDVHCSMVNEKTSLGYAALLDYVTQQRAAHGEANVVLVDAGDNLQGSSSAMLTEGEMPARVIGACGYDVITLGNHEFDYGAEKLFQLRQTEGSVPLVCCNFVDERTDERIFDAYRVCDYEVSGSTVRVGYVGAVTPSTLSSSKPTAFADKDGNQICGFCGDESGTGLYSAVQAAVDAARDDGADYVVLLGHLGRKGVMERWSSKAVVANTSGIDLVVDGHSHEMYIEKFKNKNGIDVVVSQTGCQFSSFGRIEIDPFAGTATVALDSSGLPAAAELIKQWDGKDEKMEGLIAELEAGVAEQKNKIYGESKHKLCAFEVDGSYAVRKRETNLGDFVADSIYYSAANMGEDCDIAFINGGGLRHDLAAGKITYGNLIDVCPFVNTVVSLKVTGRHILNMLEVAAASYPEASGAFLQVSEGFSYTIREDVASSVVYSTDGTKFESISGERRVRDVKLHGEALLEDKEYTICGPDFVVQLGGSCIPKPENWSSARMLFVDTQALINYFSESLKGVVGDEYADALGQGRIRITDHDEAADGGSGSSSGEEPAGGGMAGGGKTTAGNAAASGSTATKATPAYRSVPATGDASLDALSGALASAALIGAAAFGFVDEER
ncbi:bifunctional UDP-sugar hydrolase/5'-nucleotidase [Paratractidigestivibacter sp.]|uniref:bifunctional metallophosphatase/5'-nucleotidase n=1 Tax=Paratractidigestivibacter sp. TaxID=2847316 RepID=UPI002AC9E7DC|nr:bifunctional UDP-sugar hydrolase/5'-nucleotidase [Paratractidigestivibacter sp.]